MDQVVEVITDHQTFQSADGAAGMIAPTVQIQ